MPILRMTALGTAGLRLRLEMARAALAPAINGAIRQIGEEVQQMLSDAAPAGKSSSSDAAPMGDDAPGPLKDSFVSTYEPGDTSAITTVSTTQPAKLRIVREGRGEVLPKNKRALMWMGLDHPVTHAGPVAPNDFVSPVLAEATVMAYERLNEAVGEVIALTNE